MDKNKKHPKPRGRDKEEVRLENPVPDLLARYGVQVKGDRYKPFCHSSKQFSGKVSKDLCYCYVCNRSFDCFGIVKWFEGIDDLPSQVKFLGGEELPEDDPKTIKRKAEAKKRKEEVERIKHEAEAREKRIMELTEKMRFYKTILVDERIRNMQDSTWIRYYTEALVADYELGLLWDGSENGSGMLDDIGMPSLEMPATESPAA